ncbi:2OG-Fe dioxygenase family protein [Melaminivora sp.]
MSLVTFPPPYTPSCHVEQPLRDRGYAVLGPQDSAQWAGCSLAQLQALQGDWAALPPDEFLKDGGRYRYRRHASFVLDDAGLQQVPHRAHYQPLQYNALHGGMQRWFAPMLQASLALPGWQALLHAVARTTRAALAPEVSRWFIEAHQFRIDTAGGIGRPTPEGAHRDGVDLVAVFLIQRQGIKGGETRIFEASGPAGQRFTLSEPWSVLLLDDARMIHETTPIQPEAGHGWRDTLVLTCRREGFLGDDRQA